MLVVLKLISLLPLNALYLFSDLFFFLNYYCIGYRKKVVYDNLKKAFPDKSEKEIIEISKRFFRNFSDSIAENIKGLTISKAAVRKHLKFVNSRILEEYYEKGRSLVLLQTHHFNWELTLMIGPENLKYRRHVTYKKLSNHFFEKLILTMRSRFDTVMLPMYETIETIADNQKKELLCFYQLGADQSPMKHKTDHWMFFFGRKVPVFTGPEKIAKQFNLPVVFMDLRRISRGKYEVVYSIMFDNPTDTKEFEITEKYIRMVEEIIAVKPENWLWSHRRWKHAKPEI